MNAFLAAIPVILKRITILSGRFIWNIMSFFAPILVITSLFELSIVPTGSMETGNLNRKYSSMCVGDVCTISKPIYGINICSMYFRAIFPRAVLWFYNRLPKKVFFPFKDLRYSRGSTVAVVKPRHLNVVYSKRIIAIEGDTVQMKDGVLWINNKPAEMKLLVEEFDYHPGDEKKKTYKAELWQRKLENGPEHIVMHLKGYHHSNSPLITVPTGMIMCQGANIDMSNDSVLGTMWFIPRECIIGKPVMNLWSSHSTKELAKYISPTAIVALKPFSIEAVYHIIINILSLPFDTKFFKIFKVIE